MAATATRRLAQVPLHYSDGRTRLITVELQPNATTPGVILHDYRAWVKVGDREYHETTVGRAAN